MYVVISLKAKEQANGNHLVIYLLVDHTRQHHSLSISFLTLHFSGYLVFL